MFRHLRSPLLRQLRFQSTQSIDLKIKKKSTSLIPWIVSSFVIGSITAQLFPISTIFKELINEKLPIEDNDIIKFKDNLEKKAESLSIYKKLINDESFKLVRAWNYIDIDSQKIDDNTNNHSVSAHTLSVPGGIAIKPYIFVNEKEKKTITIIHVGEKLCGYPFLIHGGILFTILDEILKRTSSFQFNIDIINKYKPNLIKTKNLELAYKFPTFSNNFIIIKTELKDDKIEGKIFDKNNRLLVKSIGEFELV